MRLLKLRTMSSRASFSVLCLGALGVVFGDIGTSPLYTLKECLHASGANPGEPEVLGIQIGRASCRERV